MPWGGLAIGAVVGPDNDKSSVGGAAQGNDKEKGGQGLFSVAGHDIWLYIGGILGFGESFGPYLTTGPMIGSDPDWAIGGGVHLGKRVGLGVVLPVQQTLMAASGNDHVASFIYQAQDYVQQASAAVMSVGQQGLEMIVNNPGAMSLASVVVATGVSRKMLDPDYESLGTRIKRAYGDVKRSIVERLY